MRTYTYVYNLSRLSTHTQAVIIIHIVRAFSVRQLYVECFYEKRKKSKIGRAIIAVDWLGLSSQGFQLITQSFNTNARTIWANIYEFRRLQSMGHNGLRLLCLNIVVQIPNDKCNVHLIGVYGWQYETAAIPLYNSLLKLKMFQQENESKTREMMNTNKKFVPSIFDTAWGWENAANYKTHGNEAILFRRSVCVDLLLCVQRASHYTQ